VYRAAIDITDEPRAVPDGAAVDVDLDDAADLDDVLDVDDVLNDAVDVADAVDAEVTALRRLLRETVVVAGSWGCGGGLGIDVNDDWSKVSVAVAGAVTGAPVSRASSTGRSLATVFEANRVFEETEDVTDEVTDLAGEPAAACADGPTEAVAVRGIPPVAINPEDMATTTPPRLS
jgi:hypothetical protein